MWLSRGSCLRASRAPHNDDRSASSLAGHPCSDHRRSRVPARNREIRTPRVGRSHFGGGGSGSRSAVPTYPQPPHKWTTSPDSGRTGGSLRASRIASPHWGHRGADSGSFRTSIELSEHDGHCMQPSAECISAHAARQANTAASRAEKLVLGSAPLASHSSETGASTTSSTIDSHSRYRSKRRHPVSGLARHARHETQLKHNRNTTEAISSRARQTLRSPTATNSRPRE